MKFENYQNKPFPKHPNICFYQSLDWAHNTATPQPTERFVMFDDNEEPIMATSLFVLPFKLGFNQLYIPRGPIIYQDIDNPLIYEQFFKELHRIAKQNRAVFCLIEPDELTDTQLKGLQKYAPNINKSRLPHQTLKLDLALTDKELLDQMTPKTRYNIKLASKKGVAYEIITSKHPDFEATFEAFWQLSQVMAERSKIKIHSQQHFKELFTVQTQKFFCYFVKASHESDILAIQLQLHFDQQEIYLHGASGNTKRNLMAPHGLHWYAIQEAKKNQSLSYDFWGISDTNTKWAGITKFKKGFGGKVITYPSSLISLSLI
jgi:lipid II:glycine glycyltransferase (peptidoglycan interpeptide bridge formation enzyme)